MQVEIAGCSGFCFGVKRAMRMAQEALANNKAKPASPAGRPVYSLGHIIHNNQVVEDLSNQGLKSIKNLDGATSAEGKGVIVVSSHGASPKTLEQIKAKGFELIDATCPYVMSAQKIVKSLSEEGYLILILGDSHHPEVESLFGFANGKAIVIKDEKELDKITIASKKVGLVSQTTQSWKNYFKVISKLLTKEFIEVRIFNTICNDTQKRQESAANSAKEADVMIIVGGKMSANTKRLFEICSEICKDTYHVETPQELKKEWFEDKKKIGIASGASTPDWIIENIKNACLAVRQAEVSAGRKS